jgi:hypothetical protein
MEVGVPEGPTRRDLRGLRAAPRAPLTSTFSEGGGEGGSKKRDSQPPQRPSGPSGPSERAAEPNTESWPCRSSKTEPAGGGGVVAGVEQLVTDEGESEEGRG